MKLLILGGGDSAEREVSMQSAAAVRAAAERLGHEVGYFDPGGRLDDLTDEARQYDVVLPILHGGAGENGEVQKRLEAAGRPYLGAGPEAAALCFDKVRLKDLLRDHHITTPASTVVSADSLADSPLSRQPFVLKPVDDGSSVDLLIARELPYDRERAMEMLTRHGQMLQEELIEGTEITAPVLGDKALPVVEIVPPPGGTFDFQNKYNGSSSEWCPPKHLGLEVQARVKALALRIHQLAGVRDLSRTDMIVRPDGSSVVLEINTLPGMTAQSLYPKAAAAAGLSFDQLVARLVELALRH